MLVIEGVIEKRIFTILTSNEEFVYNKKGHTIHFINGKKQDITISNLFKEYKNINKIVLKIYEGGTLITKSTFFRRED